jgi:flavin reductase (DIM6/NTAB) family NADH-FMN oxidoreductase RutF
MNDVESTSIFHLTNHEIYVITSAYGGYISGQVATWVMLTTLIPECPRITLSISPFNYTYDLIRQSQRLVVHLLAEGQHDWIPRFGLQSSRELNKFDDISGLRSTSQGIPILPHTCGWADCYVGQQIDTGDRVICIADVVEQHINPGRIPLRKQEAFAALGPDALQQLAQKRQQDANRDREYIKPLEAIA